MTDQNTFIILILFLLNILSLLIGYILGKINTSSYSSKPISFFDKHKNNNDKANQNIEIDESKYVTKINTSGLEKKYSSLGDTKESNENISISIDKLKNLKK